MAKRILIVDDHPDFRQIIALHLRGVGYEVLEAKSGEEALRKAVDDGPDLIILDLGLPDIHGIEVVTRLKQQPITVPIPVVILTAWPREEWREKALQAGAAEFLAKPAPFATIKGTIEKLGITSSGETQR